MRRAGPQGRAPRSSCEREGQYVESQSVLGWKRSQVFSAAELTDATLRSEVAPGRPRDRVVYFVQLRLSTGSIIELLPKARSRPKTRTGRCGKLARSYAETSTVFATKRASARSRRSCCCSDWERGHSAFTSCARPSGALDAAPARETSRSFCSEAHRTRFVRKREACSG